MEKIKQHSLLYLLLIYIGRPFLIIGLIVGSIYVFGDWALYTAVVLFILLYKIRRFVFFLVQRRLDTRLIKEGYRFNYSYDDIHTSLYISVEQGLVIMAFDTNPFHYSVVDIDRICNPRVNNFVTGKGKFEGTYRAAFEFDVDDKSYQVFTLNSRKWLSPYATELETAVETAQKALDRIEKAQIRRASKEKGSE